MRLTTDDFLRRFSTGEKTGLTDLAETHPFVQAWLDDLSAAGEVDTESPELLASLQGLAALGAIDGDRVAALTAEYGGNTVVTAGGGFTTGDAVNVLPPFGAPTLASVVRIEVTAAGDHHIYTLPGCGGPFAPTHLALV